MIRIKKRRFLAITVPVIVDLSTLLALVSWMPIFAQNLEDPSAWNALLLVLIYILFSIGVYLIRKLEPLSVSDGWHPPAILMNSKTRAVLAFCFGLLMMTVVAYQIGYFESILSVGSATLDEGNSSALLVYMPGALLGFSMLYILVLAFPVQANVPLQSRRYWFLALVGLLLANCMLFFASAQARAIVIALNLSDDIQIIAVAFLMLLLFFAPPRLLFQSKQPYSLSLISFLPLLMIAAYSIAN